MSKYDKYKESAFTHEEMQPMIIETDMTDIVEELREAAELDPWYYTVNEAADEIERLREDNDKLQRMLKMAATWTAEPGVTIAEIREVFSLLDRAALGEKE